MALEGRTCSFVNDILYPLPVSPRANQGLFESLPPQTYRLLAAIPMLNTVYFMPFQLDGMNPTPLTLSSAHCLRQSLYR